jgi:hypothetical protein
MSTVGGFDLHPDIPDQTTAQVQNPGMVAVERRELNLEFLHECCGGIRIHAELAQTFAEIGDAAGVCYALRRVFAHVKVAHPVYVELRDGLASIEERAP